MGLKTAAIGPAEPADWASHRGVFASHYDQGRITRIIDPDWIWAHLAERAIAAYPDLQARTGVPFHQAAGMLHMVHAQSDTEQKHARRLANGARFGAIYEEVDREGTGAHFPFLHFPEGFQGIVERGEAGYVNPRSLLQAQLIGFHQAGGHLIRQTALRVEEAGEGMAVLTDAGERFQARRLLLTTGGFTTVNDLLLGHPLHLRVEARTITLARVGPAEVARLAAMPAIITETVRTPVLPSIYVLPPIQYPDGHWYVKLGGYKLPRIELGELPEFHAWFAQQGSEEEDHLQRQALLDLIPGLAVEGWERKACVITYTDHGYPYIDALIPGKLYVGVGGNGAAAKSSNEIGRIAALLASQGEWRYAVDAVHFRASTHNAKTEHG
jgi:sarcosine oxidase